MTASLPQATASLGMTTVDRKILMLAVDAMPDPDNVLTWTINDGRPPTPEEVRELQSLTLPEADDIAAILRLDREIDGLSRAEGWGS